MIASIGTSRISSTCPSSPSITRRRPARRHVVRGGKSAPSPSLSPFPALVATDIHLSAWLKSDRRDCVQPVLHRPCSDSPRLWRFISSLSSHVRSGRGSPPLFHGEEVRVLTVRTPALAHVGAGMRQCRRSFPSGSSPPHSSPSTLDNQRVLTVAPPRRSEAITCRAKIQLSDQTNVCKTFNHQALLHAP